MRGVATLILSLAVLLPLASTEAGAAPPYDARRAHAEADANGDGGVDRGEFHARLVEVFYFADRDRDGSLSWDELQDVVTFPEDFQIVHDDGRITLYEFEKVRFRHFDEADTDGDGLLSVEEVVAAYPRGE